MITVFLQGRLGNNLFQYAAARHLAIKNNTSVRLILPAFILKDDKMLPNVAYLRSFNIEAEVPSRVFLILCRKASCLLGKDLPPLRGKYYQEKGFGFDPDVLYLKDGAYIKGYFQSEKYFKDIEQTIRDDLRFTFCALDKPTMEYEKRIIGSNSVCLSVRRTDFLKLKLFNVCNMHYYDKAIQYMKEHLDSPRFFIFSDDIEWCQRNMNIDNSDFVDLRASTMQPINGLRLMTLCKHFIIANSTFSWWGAWLSSNAEKNVIAPNRWFNDEVMNAQALRHTIPGNWIRIDF
jgi:hypothetical protein